MNWLLLKNSFLVAGLTTIFSLLLGFLGALGLATLSKRWRNGLLPLVVLPLVLPPFLATNSWLDLLGQTGRWQAWLPCNLYSLGGTVWILTLLHWPLTLLLVYNTWRRLEPAHLEYEPSLRGFSLLRWLLWPMACRACGLAGVLTLVLSLNQFSVPALLQVKVLPASMWIQFNTTFQFTEAFRVGWPLWIGPIVLLVVWKHGATSWPSSEESISPGLLRRQLGVGWAKTSWILLGAVIVLSAGLPLTQLILNQRTWSELSSVLRTAAVPASNSFGLAILSALASLFIALLTWRWRWGLIFWLPFLIPGVAVGIGLIAVFNRPALQIIYQSLAMVVIAWTLRFLAPVWMIVRHSFQSIDPDLVDAARLSGASSWAIFRAVFWPQIAPSLAMSGYLVYLLSLWDVETLILIVPPGGETLALRVFNLLHYGHNAQVNALCLVLIGLALAPLCLWWLGCWLRRKLWTHA